MSMSQLYGNGSVRTFPEDDLQRTVGPEICVGLCV